MLKSRTFDVVLFGENNGTGEKETVKANKVIKYNGSAMKVKL
jgi:hypothetical protein